MKPNSLGETSKSFSTDNQQQIQPRVFNQNQFFWLFSQRHTAADKLLQIPAVNLIN